MVDYIIVQAGGRGSRMEVLTKNKPKALVPVNNLPMIFHLFRKYPMKKFVIIGDYKYEVLEKYLRAFADVDYKLVSASGYKGTCAGLKSALAYIPEKKRFMLIWCDLILPDSYSIPETEENIIGISKDFPCRWTYKDGLFIEEQSEEYGVAGYFIFRNKDEIRDVPDEGEFVKWLSYNPIKFKEQGLYGTKEYGLYNEWSKLPEIRCRPFNRIYKKGNIFVKEGIDEQGNILAKREVAWYKKLKDFNFQNIPAIYKFEPLNMEFINGKNIYEYKYIDEERKRRILKQIIECLKDVHNVEFVSTDIDSYYEAYIGKTFERLKKVRNLVPFANERFITINGKVCRNVFYCKEIIENIVMRYIPEKFKLIHGDCTFSNIMLRHDKEPVLIDPRGYFGNTEFYGDTAYDWVKLYYSLYSNYDPFNLKRFSLEINEDSVDLKIESNNWESLEDYFFEQLEGEVTRGQMKILLALIWLSLTTYAWQDYDSVCGAFYNGLYYLEEALEMESAYNNYFSITSKIIDDALRSISISQMEALMTECEKKIRAGKKIIVSGLGKNVPICEKFVGTMLSMGMDAGFLHTNSAVHGDMGMIHKGDLVIILTKSGSTSESIYLVDLLKKREGITLWLISFKEHSALADSLENKLIIHLEHEGDLWDIIPNNSTTLYLMVLQTVAIQLSKRLEIDLEKDFKPNHPGGAIGEFLRNGK